MRKLISLLVSAAAIAAVLAVMLLFASIYTFGRLTDETLIAEVRFERLAPDRYVAHLATGDFCTERALPIEGDQWRIDAEFVKWHYWATLLGLDSQYRLDRFEGRYSDVERENRTSGNSHSLTQETTLDIVSLADTLGELNFLIDATYGSSTYQTIEPARIYEVYKSPTGVFTRSRDLSPRPDRDGLAVEIRRACGDDVSAWRKITAWVDRAAVRVL